MSYLLRGPDLYSTRIGVTKGDIAAAIASFDPPKATPTKVLLKANAEARAITRSGEDGPLIVTYPGPRPTPNSKKDNAMSPMGKMRNSFGGFFCS